MHTVNNRIYTFPYLHVQNQPGYLILLIVYDLEYKIEQFRRLESLQILV